MSTPFIPSADTEYQLLALFGQLTEMTSQATKAIPEGVKEFKTISQKTPDSLDYPPEERRADKTRVVRFVAAETALEGLEDQLMLDYVQRPSDSLLTPFYGTWTALRKIAPILWQIGKQVFSRVIRGQLMILYVVAAMIALAVVVTSTVDIKRIKSAHIDALNFYVQWLRNLALPQRSATRRRVRKRTRD